MKLINKYPDRKLDEYFCNITSELDRLAGIDSSSHRKHYVLADKFCIGNKCLAIRIPGGTLGEIAFKNNRREFSVTCFRDESLFLPIYQHYTLSYAGAFLFTLSFLYAILSV